MTAAARLDLVVASLRPIERATLVLRTARSWESLDASARRALHADADVQRIVDAVTSFNAFMADAYNLLWQSLYQMETKLSWLECLDAIVALKTARLRPGDVPLPVRALRMAVAPIGVYRDMGGDDRAPLSGTLPEQLDCLLHEEFEEDWAGYTALQTFVSEVNERFGENVLAADYLVPMAELIERLRAVHEILCRRDGPFPLPAPRESTLAKLREWLPPADLT
jgi:hypothetical protein